MTLDPGARILPAVRDILWLWLVWLVVVASLDVANADSASDATKSFAEAVALKEAGKYAEACSKFEQSFELDKKAGRAAPGTQLNLGECAEREGQLRKAYVLFDDAEKDYGRRAKAAEAAISKDPASAELKRDLERALAGQKLARQRADVLAPRLAKVVVRVTEPGVSGLSIKIGDRSVPPTSEVIEYLDGGNVTITATAPGRDPFTTSAKAEAGKSVVVEIPALRVGGDNSGDVGGVGGRSGAGSGGSIPPGPVSRRQRKRVLIAGALGGGGVVVFGVSVVLGLGAKSDYNEAKKNCTSENGRLVCRSTADRDAIDKAFSKADTATVLGIAGLGLLAAGAVVYFTAPKETITVMPMASSTTAGVSLSGHF